MNQQENNSGQQQKVESVETASINYGKTKGVPYYTSDIKSAFIAGANWQQSQSIEPMVDKVLPDVELVASKVHDSWWQAKKDAGFHSPIDCESGNHKSYINSSWQNQDRFNDHFNERTYKWCDKCHPDMIPYEDLADNIKEYDRVTVRTVYDAITSLIPQTTTP